MCRRRVGTPSFVLCGSFPTTFSDDWFMVYKYSDTSLSLFISTVRIFNHVGETLCQTLISMCTGQVVKMNIHMVGLFVNVHII